MTTNGGRLRAVLSCGVAASALLTLPAAAQDAAETVIDAETTTPVATSETGDLRVTGAGAIVVGNGAGPAIVLDADADATIEAAGDGEDGGRIDLGTDGVSEQADVAAIAVTGDVAGDVSVAGTVRVLSSAEITEGLAPPAFPSGRLGLLVAQDARLAGTVAFAEGSTVSVESAGGAGVGVLGTLDGTLTADGTIRADGDGSAGLRVAGTVTGDVAVGGGSGTAPAIVARGQGANGIDVGGTVGGTLSVGSLVQSTAFTDVAGLPDPEDGEEALSVAAQDALAPGAALRVTGAVEGGLLLRRARAEGGTEEAPVGAQAAANVATDGAAPAVLLSGGAVIGTLGGEDDEAGDDARGLVGFGVYNGGTILANVARGDTDAVAFRVDDAVVTGGLFNDANAQQDGVGIRAAANGDDASATAILLGEGADLGRILNAGSVTATAVTDTGEAVAIRDLSGTLAEITNTGLIGANTLDFAGQRRGEDGEPVFETREDEDGNVILDADGNPRQFPVLDDDAPQGRAIAIDLRANTSGARVASTGAIQGDVLLGGGDDELSIDGRGTLRASQVDLSGAVALGDGDDLLRLTNSALAVIDAELGAGFDRVVLDGGSRAFGRIGFGSTGGAVSLTEGASFSGTFSDADGVDVTVGGAGSVLNLTGGATIGSLTTLEGDGQGAVLSFSVSEDGRSVSRLNVLGDATIAPDTSLRLAFERAFDDPILGAPIITAGGTLDADLSQDQLSAVGVVPFLFTQSLSLSEDGQSVLVDLRRKSPSEIGLDPAIAPAYEPLIDALVAANTDVVGDQGEVLLGADAPVGQALFNITGIGDPDDPDFDPAAFEASARERFTAAFEQFLPGPLDGPLTYARVQNDSVASLVTQRVTRLRDGEDGRRRRGAWLQEQSYFVNRSTEGAARGFDGGGFVIALGADTPLGPVDTVGVSASIASARYDEETGEDFPFDRLTRTVGAYAAQGLGPIRLDGRFSYGWASSESERNVVISGVDEDGMATGEGDVRRTTTAEWDGTQLAGYGRVLYEGRLGAWDVQPFASVDYLRLEEDAYQEAGAEDRVTSLGVDEREVTSLRGNAGVILGREFKTRPSRFGTSIPATIAPRVTLAYTDELDGDPLTGTYRFAAGEAFTLEQEKPGAAGIAGFDLVYENEYARLGAGGSVTASDELQVYQLRVGVGLKW